LKRELKIAVRDLVHYVFSSGDLTFEFLASTRPVDAIRIHQRIQQSRPPEYRPEVAVSLQVETKLFTLTIGGRIDGVFFDADPVLVEEIKTTTRSLDQVEQNANLVHWGQVKCYAYIYAKEHNLSQVEAQLTYYQVDTGEIRELRHAFTFDDLAVFFDDLLSEYLHWAETIVGWGRLRDDSAHKLEFPFSVYRPGQREMAVAVYRRIKNGDQILVQAATGIGKTMATVFPAVKSIAEGHCTKIFYLTARTTGRMAAEKALDELRHKGLKLKSLTITAKDKICFNPTNACNSEECEFARGHFDRIKAARQDMFSRDSFTRAVIEHVGRAHRVCPFEFSLEMALWADCIICDYNYAFDPRVYLRRFFLEENADYTFLVDEAHNLADRSREMFSAEIFKQQVLDVRRAIRKPLPHIYKSLGKVNSWLVKARKQCEKDGLAHYKKDAPEDLLTRLRTFSRITERWLSKNIKAPFREDLLNLFFVAAGFLRVAEQFNQSYATCFEKIDRDLRIKLFCIDPSEQLKNALHRCRAAIFFSATMTPMDYFKRILGCNDGAASLDIPSPFPGTNLSLFVQSGVSTLYRDRERTKRYVSQAICTLIRQKKGNYLIFFPSYEYLLMVFDEFLGDCPDIEKIYQTPGMSENEREDFLKRFGQENSRTLVGFAVMGGIFGEGIDLVGDRLCGAVIVGVGLPGISLERELIRDYFSGTLSAGFEYAYQYPGINRVLQAAGRVIRTETDRGVVLLIDQRYGTYRYRSLLPAEWRPVKVQSGAELSQALQKFWNR